jgi:NAD(P)-dependent dehydrogenase (short-subunit alcohol dehydrogenase family)
MPPLTDRVALVTGAASGIGRATAIRLAADGATVGCLGLDRDGLVETAQMILDAGGHAITFAADVTDRQAVDIGARRIAGELGPIGIVVNNAGIPGAGKFVDVNYEDWRRVIEVHVDGAFHVTQAVLPAMLEAGWGRVINVASETVWLGQTSVQYATAKAALLGFTRSLARQVAGSGVLVNAVAPGPVDTPMMHANSPEEIEWERRTVLIGRLLTADEIAASIAFLAGPGGDAYVGQVISPNGGTVFPG